MQLNEVVIIIVVLGDICSF